jgi:hypothetical protein
LVADKSSNGKGTRTTLPLVIKRFTIGQCVDVFIGFFEEIEGRVARCGLQPLLLVYVGLIRDQDDDTNSTGADDRQGLVQLQSPLCINGAPYFYRF